MHAEEKVLVGPHQQTKIVSNNNYEDNNFFLLLVINHDRRKSCLKTGCLNRLHEKDMWSGLLFSFPSIILSLYFL